jgi:multidrug efflux system membrane fusion protein
MDTPESGQSYLDARAQPRRSGGRLARSAMSAAFLLGMAFSSAALAQDQLPVVSAAKPVVREIVEDDEFVGRFDAVDQVAIRSRVGGYLDKVDFHDGALVKKGDRLFTIDQRPYQAAYDAAKSQVDVAKSLLEFSKMQLERAEELAKTGNISTATVDDRRREYLSAQAQMQGATAAMTTASLNLEFTEITAPLAGRIDRRLVSVGNLVQQDSTLLTTIVALDPIDFYFDVDERLYFS